MISRLSDLLRITFDRTGEPKVSLKDEIDFLQKYLDIEQTRFQDRLRVSVNIDPEALDGEVPRMILQPIVENAIKHGIAGRNGGDTVQVTAGHEAGRLWMQVSDNGGGLQVRTLKALRTGVGLSNTRARLDCLYGRHYRLEFSDKHGGLSVLIEIPFQRVSVAGPPAASASHRSIMTTPRTRVLIVDDEPLARERIRTLLAGGTRLRTGRRGRRRHHRRRVDPRHCSPTSSSSTCRCRAPTDSTSSTRSASTRCRSSSSSPPTTATRSAPSTCTRSTTC